MNLCASLFLTPEFGNTLVLLWSYMLIYNVSLFVIFSTLFQFTNSELKTTHSFSSIGANQFYSATLIISLFSMAGVPPFCGFFAKVFLFTLLANAHFFVLFPFFFLILFIGLYFYIQNIRFLNSRAGADFHPIIELNLRNSPLYYYLTFTILFFLIFGFIFTEDIILIMSWLLF